MEVVVTKIKNCQKTNMFNSKNISKKNWLTTDSKKLEFCMNTFMRKKLYEESLNLIVF